MAGSLAVTNEESTWVLTSYLVSNAIVLPVSGWIAGLFGRRRFFLTCIVLFTLSSVLCGLASSLALLILFLIILWQVYRSRYGELLLATRDAEEHGDLAGVGGDTDAAEDWAPGAVSEPEVARFQRGARDGERRRSEGVACRRRCVLQASAAT